MPQADDRFKVTISFKVEKNHGEESIPYSETTQVYPAMPYGDMVMVEKVALESLVKGLTDMGLQVAEEMKGGKK